MDERQQADTRLDAVEPDLLDEAALPVLGLSALTLGAVFAGGALGTLGRYLLEAFHPLSPGQFPWVTLLVNLSGSLAIALLLPLTAPRRHGPPVARSLLIVGFLGGWTTYSTLAVELTLLGRHGDLSVACGYAAATVAGGAALVVVGHAAGQRLGGWRVGASWGPGGGS